MFDVQMLSVKRLVISGTQFEVQPEFPAINAAGRERISTGPAVALRSDRIIALVPIARDWLFFHQCLPGYLVVACPDCSEEKVTREIRINYYIQLRFI